MSRFNTRNTEKNQTENFAGGEAYKETPALEFISILLTSFVQDSYYRSSDDTLKRLRELIKKINDKKFVAKGAIYARNEFGMRSITHVVGGELASIVKGEPWMKNFFDKVVRRPDDMTEILSYYLKDGKKPIPNSMKKGLAKAFDKFNEYQLAKYRSGNKDISLVDLVNLVHPTPRVNNKEALAKLVKGELKSKDTWEVRQTQAGQKAKTEEEKTELKKQEWIDLIKTKKIGYFALLRNLRNIIKQAPEVIDEAIEMLKDEKLIKNSLVLPFRFYAAYKEIKLVPSTKSAKVLDALSQALDISCKNIPGLKGDVMIGIDNSHSMKTNNMSAKSKMTRCDVACILSCMLHKRSPNTITSVFADKFKVTNLSPSATALQNMQSLEHADVGLGYETNGFKVVEYATKNKIKLDYFVIFTDLQMYDAEGVTYERTPPAEGRSFKKELAKYKKEVNSKVKVYSFDCAGYGTLQIPQGDPNSYLIPGFSDKIFDIMKILETDREALINKINKIEL